MHYKVFLDTNIYDGANYSFRNSLFSRLKEYAEHGNLEIQINSVVKGEVCKHIKRKIKKAVKTLNSSLTMMELQLFRTIPEYDVKMETNNPKEWVERALAEFESYLASCKAEEITVNGIDVEGIVGDYFSMKYPFEEAKKDEFPDAIIIRSILKEIQSLSGGLGWFPDYIGSDNVPDDLLYCVVSGDKGFLNALGEIIGARTNEDVKCFSSLNEVVNYIAIQDESAADLQRKLGSGYAKEFIETTIEEGLSCTEYSVDDPDGYVDNTDIIGTGNYKYKPFVIGLQEMSEGRSIARISVDASFDVTLEYDFIHETESYWDKEDHEYLWRIRTYRTAIFTAEAAVSFTVWIDKNGEIEFNDYVEVPRDIEGYDTDMIELISSEDREDI